MPNDSTGSAEPGDPAPETGAAATGDQQTNSNEKPPQMTDFQPATLPRQFFSYRHHMETYGLNKPDAKRMVRRMQEEKVWINDLYQVHVAPATAPNPNGFPSMIHLSIKRRDRGVVHDWRDLQMIKNMLVGPEHEAVELYPAESRLVDTANQYHLWVLADNRQRYPFGFNERLVSDVSIGGSFNRPFADDPRRNNHQPPAAEGQKDAP